MFYHLIDHKDVKAIYWYKLFLIRYKSRAVKPNVNFWQHTAIRQTHGYIMGVNNFIFSIIFIELIEFITRWKKSSEISVMLMDSYLASNCSYGDIFWRNRQCYNTFFNNQYSYITGVVSFVRTNLTSNHFLDYSRWEFDGIINNSRNIPNAIIEMSQRSWKWRLDHNVLMRI